MKILAPICWLGLSLSLIAFGQGSKLPYTNDFQQAALDKVPEDLTVLDGAFAVKEDQGNRFLELPGDPLDSFGVLFGPSEKEGVQASVRVFGTSKGRRYPTFALGLNGVGGYRVQVSPGKKLLELYRGDTVKTNLPFAWVSGHWTELRLQVLKSSGGSTVRAKVWQTEKPEPSEWMVTVEDAQELPAGRAGIYGSPFAGTPIRYDDLAVVRVPEVANIGRE